LFLGGGDISPESVKSVLDEVAVEPEILEVTWSSAALLLVTLCDFINGFRF